MSDRVSFSTCIHAHLESAHCYTPTGGNRGSLTLELTGYSSVSIFTEDDALAVKLAAAINSTIAAHKAEQAAPLLQAAE